MPNSWADLLINELTENNRKWAQERLESDPSFFLRLQRQQSPEYLWIGCADSRVPANVIMGLEPGEVFTQRNVGNQATHTDLNVMACLEYAVTTLKVKVIICCGHYGCGAVKAALTLPSKTPGLVNCWISDIRECRNQHQNELKILNPDDQIDRLCELNVIRQTFHVCTSPIVQAAWDQGQELAVYGMIYSLSDGLVDTIVGPLTRVNSCHDVLEYQQRVPPKLSRSSLRTSTGYNKENQRSNSSSNVASAKEADPVRKQIEEKLSLEVMRSASLGGPDLCPVTPTPVRQSSSGTSYRSPTTEAAGTRSSLSSEDGAGRTSLKNDNTKMLAGNVLQHVGWAGKSSH